MKEISPEFIQISPERAIHNQKLHIKLNIFSFQKCLFFSKKVYFKIELGLVPMKQD